MKKDRFRFVLSASLLLFLFVSNNTALAISVSSSSSSNAISSSGGGSVWTNPLNALSGDDSYATNSLSSSEDPENQNTNNLKVTGFDFTLPPEAHIDGIELEVEKYASNNTSAANTKDLSVKIIKTSNPSGAENKANSVDYWGVSDTVYTYGASNDLWGDTWTTSDINSPDFGVLFSARLNAQASTITANVDSFKITVHYTMPLLDSIEVSSAVGEMSVPETLQVDGNTLDQFGDSFNATQT